MRIAIVGTGISGLAAAHLLHPSHEITVFEAEDWIGGHTHTVDVATSEGDYAVDTGFIVYNERTYPNFSRLLDGLAVATQPTEMSFGLASERSGIEWASRGPMSVFAQPLNLLRPSFLRMLRDVIRFNRESRKLLAQPGEKATLREYLTGADYSAEFSEHYVRPMGAAIWSADPEEFLDMPAATFVRFFENHGLLEVNPSLPWRIVKGGSRCYVEKLVVPFRDRIRLETTVHAVRRKKDAVELQTRAGREQFDRVVLAVHSDQALATLADATDLERSVLGAIRYQQNEAVLHTDTSLLPRSLRAQASWNYRIPEDPQAGVLVTYDMNRLQNLESSRRLLLTLNDHGRVREEHVLGRFTVQHPVLDGAAIAAQKLRSDISGKERIHFSGAYWGYGFHEDGVRSAIEVVKELRITS